MRVQSPLVALVALTLSVVLAYPVDAAQRQRWPSESRGGQSQGGQGQSGQRQGAQSQGGQSQGRQSSGRQSQGRAQPRSGGEGRQSTARPAGEPRQQSPARAARPAARERQEGDARPTASQRREAAPRRAPAAARRPAQSQPDPDPIARPLGEARSDSIARRDDTAQSRRRAEARGPDRTPSRSRVAVQRQNPPRRRGDNNWNGYRVYRPYSRPHYHGYPLAYYYRPYSYGYGPAGRGYFYFDVYYNSYVWHPRTVIRYTNSGSYGYPTGELRLQVRPRDAQVFVDGYYAGTVDDFDGVFQSLRLEDGDYRIEIVLPGYEPLDFDVRILPGEKITYKGELLPELQ